jgi:hypothetical protein
MACAGEIKKNSRRIDKSRRFMLIFSLREVIPMLLTTFLILGCGYFALGIIYLIWKVFMEKSPI